jgi:nitrate reductase beta subunit
MTHLRLLPPIEDGEPIYVCVTCGETWTARDGLEQHWEAEKHGPEDVQRQRLLGARRNNGWLLTEESDPE